MLGLTGSVSLQNIAGLHWIHNKIVSHILKKINTRNYDVFEKKALTSFHTRRKVFMDIACSLAVFIESSSQ